MKFNKLFLLLLIFSYLIDCRRLTKGDPASLKLKEEIGSGSYGSVFSAVFPGIETEMAIKYFENDKTSKNFLKELEFMLKVCPAQYYFVTNIGENLTEGKDLVETFQMKFEKRTNNSS